MREVTCTAFAKAVNTRTINKLACCLGLLQSKRRTSDKSPTSQLVGFKLSPALLLVMFSLPIGPIGDSHVIATMITYVLQVVIVYTNISEASNELLDVVDFLLQVLAHCCQFLSVAKEDGLSCVFSYLDVQRFGVHGRERGFGVQYVVWGFSVRVRREGSAVKFSCGGGRRERGSGLRRGGCAERVVAPRVRHGGSAWRVRRGGLWSRGSVCGVRREGSASGLCKEMVESRFGKRVQRRGCLCKV